MRRVTADHHVPYFVKPDFRLDGSSELKKLERQVEEDLHLELRQISNNLFPREELQCVFRHYIILHVRFFL